MGRHRADPQKGFLERIFSFFLHDWMDAGGFIAEGGAYTRQQCRKCEKTRVNRFFEVGRNG